MFYKVENGMLIEAPKKSLKLFIANPTEEQYRLFGYTDKVIEDSVPYVEEGKQLEEYYEQIDGVIYKHYRLVDVPTDEIQPAEEEV